LRSTAARTDRSFGIAGKAIYAFTIAVGAQLPPNLKPRRCKVKRRGRIHAGQKAASRLR
jgi:hypothetical protein